VRSFASSRSGGSVSTSDAHFRTSCVLWTSRTRSSPSAAASAAQDGLGSPHDAREVVELAKHNSVFRLATASPAHELVELKSFDRWLKSFEAPTLREGASAPLAVDEPLSSRA